jgi:hypothetical protein
MNEIPIEFEVHGRVGTLSPTVLERAVSDYFERHGRMPYIVRVAPKDVDRARDILAGIEHADAIALLPNGGTLRGEVELG